MRKMKEIEEEWGRRWEIRSSGDVKNSGEENELKKFGPTFLSFDDDDMECCIRRHFLIVASKPPNEHVNLPK